MQEYEFTDPASLQAALQPYAFHPVTRWILDPSHIHPISINVVVSLLLEKIL
jgi:hypothetical protein